MDIVIGASMKLVLDERIKHRLVGIAVILSIGIIFTPALFKKSMLYPFI